MIMNTSLSSERVIYWTKLRIFFLDDGSTATTQYIEFMESALKQHEANQLDTILLRYEVSIFVALSIHEMRPLRAYQSLNDELIHHDLK